MELSKELLERINAAVEADQIVFKQAAKDLGLTLNEGAISGRRQGYFKGVRDEALRSQKLVQGLEQVIRCCKATGTPMDRVVADIMNEAQKSLTQYNQQPDSDTLKEQV